MILHTLSTTPSDSAFTQCSDVAKEGDAILLMGDAVYAAIIGTSALLALKATGASLYALQSDLNALGVTADACFECVSIDGFVSLTEQYVRHQAWH